MTPSMYGKSDKILTPEQQAVFDQALAFIAASRVDRPYFLYEGLAGTGKTVVLSELAHALPRATMCAFTGKAASNLSRKTGLMASTIHSAIYQFLGEDRETKRLMFKEKVDIGGWTGAVALVDESSTVSVQLGQDLLRTGARVIACGDPGQLPPVGGEPFFQGADARLETVHRQAWDSPIIRQAHRVRHGGGYAADGPDFRVQRWISPEEILGAGIVLCWKNATRMYLNRLVRAHRLGLHDMLAPEPLHAGEPVMFLRNDYKYNVLNGAIYELQEDRRPWEGFCIVNEQGDAVEVPGRLEDYEPSVEGRDQVPFCLGYCATVHKYIGSEADHVILVDEYNREEDYARWSYTGITRAVKSIIIQRDW